MTFIIAMYFWPPLRSPLGNSTSALYFGYKQGQNSV